MELSNPNLELIIQAMKEYFNEQTSKNILFKKMYLIQHEIINLRREYGLNVNHDPTIISPSIINSFENKNEHVPFSPSAYEFNFLSFLARNYGTKNSLIHIIDEFIQLFKNNFSCRDIEITKTGATRCKTNIRFAVMKLRDKGLLREKKRNLERNNGKIWSPTILGLLVLFYVYFFQENNSFQFSEHYFVMNSIKSKYKTFYIENVLHEMRSDINTHSLLSKLNEFSEIHDFDLLERILENYRNILVKNLIITSTGIKISKDMKNDTANFLIKFSYIHNGELYSSLLKIYNKLTKASSPAQ